MPDINPSPKLCPTDIELMNLAKKRVHQRNVFKLHFGTFFVSSVCIVMYLLIISWTILAILLILLIFGWGLVVAIHGVIIRFKLSDIRINVTGEYYRLRQLAAADNSEREKPL